MSAIYRGSRGGRGLEAAKWLIVAVLLVVAVSVAITTVI